MPTSKRILCFPLLFFFPRRLVLTSNGLIFSFLPPPISSFVLVYFPPTFRVLRSNGQQCYPRGGDETDADANLLHGLRRNRRSLTGYLPRRLSELPKTPAEGQGRLCARRTIPVLCDVSRSLLGSHCHRRLCLFLAAPSSY